MLLDSLHDDGVVVLDFVDLRGPGVVSIDFGGGALCLTSTHIDLIEDLSGARDQGVGSPLCARR